MVMVIVTPGSNLAVANAIAPSAMSAVIAAGIAGVCAGKLALTSRPKVIRRWALRPNKLGSFLFQPPELVEALRQTSLVIPRDGAMTVKVMNSDRP